MKEFISTVEEKDMQIEDYKIRAWKKGTVNYKALGSQGSLSEGRAMETGAK